MGNILTNSRVKTIEKDIEVSLKRLSTNIAPITYDSFMGQFENTATSISLLSVLLIVYAANIFASEYTSGTVKLLLITPHKRKRIFWAKTILMVELSVIALAANFILAFLISGSFTAFRGIDSMQVMHLFGNVVQLPYLLYILLKYLVMMLPVLTYGALAMMMSVITRKKRYFHRGYHGFDVRSDIIISIITMFSGSFVIPGINSCCSPTPLLKFICPRIGFYDRVDWTDGGPHHDPRLFGGGFACVYGMLLWIAATASAAAT